MIKQNGNADNSEALENLKASNEVEHKNFTQSINSLQSEVNELKSSAGTPSDSGSLNVFGLNNYYQLGDNITDVNEIRQMPMFSNVTNVVSSATAGIMLNNGSVKITGSGFSGSGFWETFSALADWRDVDDVGGCYNVGFAIRKGRLFSWGNGGYYTLGDGSTGYRYFPKEVVISDGSSAEKIKKIVSAPYIAYALCESGKVYSCGASYYGAGGNTQNLTSSVFTGINNLNGITDIAAGGLLGQYAASFGMALNSNNNTLLCWGYNGDKQFGMGSSADISYSTPQIIQLPSGVTISKIAAGARHSVILTVGGDVYIAGYIKAGTTYDTFTKVIFRDDENNEIIIKAIDIAAGINTTSIVGENGMLYAVGEDINGSLLGLGSSIVPVRLSNKSAVKVFAHCTNYGASFFTAEDDL